MSYRVDPVTGDIICDTLEDARRASYEIRQQAASPAPQVASGTGAGNAPGAIEKTVRQLSVNAKQVLSAVLGAPGRRMTGRALREALKIQNTTALGGRIAGISKTATKYQCPLNRFLKIEEGDDGGLYIIPESAVADVRAGLEDKDA